MAQIDADAVTRAAQRLADADERFRKSRELLKQADTEQDKAYQAANEARSLSHRAGRAVDAARRELLELITPALPDEGGPF